MDDRTRGARVALVCWLVAGATLTGAGCATKGADADAELQELIQLLPGHYDNTAQAQADLAHGIRPAHDALALDIVPIDAIMIGDNVFYVQETAAGDPRRVTGQKLLMFGVVKKQIVQTDLSLAEPHRWRNGHLNPDLFKGLMTQDVHSSKGCSLRWKKVEGHFVGANEPKTCHGRAGAIGGMAQIDSRAELGPEEYAVSELAFDKPGHALGAHQDDPFYRFHKQTKESPEPETTSSGD